ncbi:MAG: TonB-dependent receptor [Alphaproteobacteria bacterium]
MSGILKTWQEGRFLAVSAFTSVLALTVGAVAQETAAPDDGDETAPAVESDRSRTTERLLITATKREAEVIDVPISVTALNAESIERAGIFDVSQLGILSPSFTLNTTQTESQGATIRLRGIGTTGNNIGLESSVGIFIDGVYQSRPGIALGDFLDVAQVEVLRGPQGTLFGRNTSAGALTVQSRRPNLGEVEYFGNATYGNLNTYQVQGGVSVPIIENELAIRVAGSVRGRDGILDSTTGGESGTRDRFQFRGQILWEPDDRLSIRLIGDFADAEEECCDAVIRFDPLNGSGVFEAAGLPADGGAPVIGEQALEDRISNGREFSNDVDQFGISGEITYDLDFATLTYIGAYRDFNATFETFTGFTNLDIIPVPGTGSGNDDFFGDSINTQTHEVRLQGQSGRFDWLVGGFVFREDIEEQFTLTLGTDYDAYISATAWFGGILALPGIEAFAPVPLVTGGTFGDVLASTNPARVFAGGVDATGAFGQNLFQQETRSFSFFTHNNIAITDRFDIVIGARYTNEDKFGRFIQLAASSPACLNTAANAGGLPAEGALVGALAIGFACFPFAAEADIPGTEGFLPSTFDDVFQESQVTGTFSGVYAVTDNVNIYATYSRGFKSGGFNLDSTAAIGGADPSFDSEIINTYEGGLKGEFFNGNLQANVAAFHNSLSNFQVLEFTGVQFVTFNVPRALSTGFEVELTGTPMDNLQLSGAVTYADARYPDDCDDGDPNARIEVSSLCGFRLTNAALWAATFGGIYNYDIPNTRLTAFISANGRFETERRTSTQAVDLTTGVPLAGDIQPSNGKLNLRIGIGDVNQRWALEVFANNVFDNQTQNVTFNVPLRGTGALGTQARGSFIEEPRIYGVTLRFEH